MSAEWRVNDGPWTRASTVDDAVMSAWRSSDPGDRYEVRYWDGSIFASRRPGGRCESRRTDPRSGKPGWRCERELGHDGDHRHFSAGRRWDDTGTTPAPV